MTALAFAMDTLPAGMPGGGNAPLLASHAEAAMRTFSAFDQYRPCDRFCVPGHMQRVSHARVECDRRAGPKVLLVCLHDEKKMFACTRQCPNIRRSQGIERNALQARHIKHGEDRHLHDGDTSMERRTRGLRPVSGRVVRGGGVAACPVCVCALGQVRLERRGRRTEKERGKKCLQRGFATWSRRGEERRATVGGRFFYERHVPPNCTPLVASFSTFFN